MHEKEIRRKNSSCLIRDLFIVFALHQIAIENNTVIRLQFNELLLDWFIFFSFNKQDTNYD